MQETPENSILGHLTNSVSPGLQPLQSSARVGSVFSMDYSKAIVAVFDYHREEAGGLPKGGFLVAATTNHQSRLILLRTLGEARLPEDALNEQTRLKGIENTANVSHWSDSLDRWILDRLSIHGIECRVLGTFAFAENECKFAEDIDNYYAVNQLEVWKPSQELLGLIVNYSHRANPMSADIKLPTIGWTRFAASEPADSVRSAVMLNPIDLLQRRTAYLGMSRSGKSNAMKVTAESVYRLRADNPELRIGQLIFDPNGEYAQDTEQDGAGLHRIHETIGRERLGEVVTYGLFPTASDPERTILKINFYGDPFPPDWSAVPLALEQLLAGRDIVVDLMSNESARYTSGFRDADLSVPENAQDDHGTQVRYRRTILAYQTALRAAGLNPPTWTPSVTGLFSEDLINALRASKGDNQGLYLEAAETITRAKNHNGLMQWDQLERVFTAIYRFINDKSSQFSQYDGEYIQNSSKGESWADAKFRSVLGIFYSANGPRSFQKASDQHDPSSSKDFADEIIDHLADGKLVIVDQSTGDPEHNRSAAERIMWKVFNSQQAWFRNSANTGALRGGLTRQVLIYVEEAHNLLPRSSGTENLRSVWARAAKEGSKMNLGMVLATQAPSSIMPEILSETDNWILAYLNSRNERNVIAGYMDFEDFLDQIGQVSEPGFVRMRTLSQAYTVPVQIRQFNLATPSSAE